MHCSTYLSLPTLESLAHSSSSASSTRSSCSLFDRDPQGSDSQSDSSPPEEDQRSTPITPPLKFLPDHAPCLGLDAKLKQRRRKRTSDWLSGNDDVGYDSEREGAACRKRDKVRTRKRGAPQCPSTDSTPRTPEGMGPSGVDGFPCAIFSLGLGLPGDHELAFASTPPLTCPVKPRLLPVLDAASPSPIFPLPSPVVDLGTPSKLGLSTKISTNDCSINQTNSTLESASWKVSVGLGLGISLPDPELQTDTSFPVIDQSRGGPLSQAIAFASIPFYFAQPRRKKPATGLGLGRPPSVGQRLQVEHHAPRPVFLSRLPSYAAGNCLPLVHGPPTFSDSSLSRPRLVVGARRLLKSYRFPKRYLYAIPEVLTTIGMSGTNAAHLVFSPA